MKPPIGWTQADYEGTVRYLRGWVRDALDMEQAIHTVHTGGSMSKVRTYEINTTNGLVRMEIPEDWKVTFGPVAIGAKGSRFDQSFPYALRVYESETKQRAIFTDVRSFRDLSIPISRLFKREEGNENWTTDTDGNTSAASKKNVVREWRREETVPEKEVAA